MATKKHTPKVSSKVKNVNLTLLRKVRANILATPHLFSMLDWQQKNDCGTACCIGGWALAAKGIHQYTLKTKADLVAAEKQENYYDKGEDVWAKGTRILSAYYDPAGGAQEALKLSNSQAKALFYTDHWPELYRTVYNQAQSNNEPLLMAAAGAARIDHFIATGE